MKNQKGITLIALIITIIVMMILVAVSVTVALNSGLFSAAQKAAKNTQAERENETALSAGNVTINGQQYTSLEEYVQSLGGAGSGGEKVAITPKKEDYTVGEPVTIGNESFYVIANDAVKVTLLAKYNINTTTLVQDASAQIVKFSSTNYWKTIEGITYPYDLNETPTSADTDAIALARTYGTNLGGTGRLMTKAEAVALEYTHKDILLGREGKSYGSYLIFWLGTACDNVSAYHVDGRRTSGISSISNNAFMADTIDGVRPVVEVLKSNI